MMQLHPTPLRTQGLTNFVSRQLMIGEASEMGFQRCERLYDDAADMGIALRSHRTGAVTRWYLLDRIVDPREGELLGWMFKPTPESIRQFPHLAGYQLNMLND